MASATDRRDPGAARATLLLSSPHASAHDERCLSLLRGGDALAVTYRTDPAGWLASREDAADRSGADRSGVDGVAFVSAVGGRAPPGAPVRTVGDPADLTGLGIELSRAIADARPAGVCFDSLTTLCQYADRHTAYRFVARTVARARAAGASVHVHLDPAAHDEEAVRAFEQPFDAVVRG